MWVFDGETWSREGGSDEATSRSFTVNVPSPDEMIPVPELQILEILPTPRTREIHVPVAVPDVVRKPR